MDRSARFPSRILILVALSLTPLIRQPVFTNVFPPAEFAARRAEVMKAIGTVLPLQGTTERPREQPFRQSNQFFYPKGVVEPRAILLIDGRKKTSTLYLRPRDRASRKDDVRSWS